MWSSEVLRGSFFKQTNCLLPNQYFFFHLFIHLLLRVERLPDSVSHPRSTLFITWLLLSSCSESILSTDKNQRTFAWVCRLCHCRWSMNALSREGMHATHNREAASRKMPPVSLSWLCLSKPLTRLCPRPKSPLSQLGLSLYVHSYHTFWPISLIFLNYFSKLDNGLIVN